MKSELPAFTEAFHPKRDFVVGIPAFASATTILSEIRDTEEAQSACYIKNRYSSFFAI